MNLLFQVVLFNYCIWSLYFQVWMIEHHLLNCLTMTKQILLGRGIAIIDISGNITKSLKKKARFQIIDKGTLKNFHEFFTASQVIKVRLKGQKFVYVV